MMQKLWILVIGLMMGSFLVQAGSLDSDFSKKSAQKEWELRIGKGYGTEPGQHQDSEGYISVKPLTPAKHHYLSYDAEMKLKEGIRYHLRFEARIGGGSYRVKISDSTSRDDRVIHFRSKKLEASTEFQVHEFEFMAKRDSPKKSELSFVFGVAEKSFDLKSVTLEEIEP